MTTPSAYGDVLVTLNGRDYTVRLGLLEFRKLQELYDVKGVVACILAGNSGDAEKEDQFYLVALSRNQPDVTLDMIPDLRDIRATGEPGSLQEAIEAALRFSYPKLFEDEPPKATPATSPSKA